MIKSWRAAIDEHTNKENDKHKTSGKTTSIKSTQNAAWVQTIYSWEEWLFALQRVKFRICLLAINGNFYAKLDCLITGCPAVCELYMYNKNYHMHIDVRSAVTCTSFRWHDHHDERVSKCYDRSPNVSDRRHCQMTTTTENGKTRSLTSVDRNHLGVFVNESSVARCPRAYTHNCLPSGDALRRICNYVVVRSVR